MGAARAAAVGDVEAPDADGEGGAPGGGGVLVAVLGGLDADELAELFDGNEVGGVVLGGVAVGVEEGGDLGGLVGAFVEGLGAGEELGDGEVGEAHDELGWRNVGYR